MSLFTKSILKEREPFDGLRISVMSRHTLNDGITPDERITYDSFDEHYVALAPRSRLIGDYYKRGLSWDEFESRYLAQIRESDAIPIVRRLAERALNENVTLLCIEETAERCHRRLLAEECKRVEPELLIEHR